MKRRVIIVTDGDQEAQLAVETAAKKLGVRCISASAGNPTPLSGEEIVGLVMTAPDLPIVVFVDDKGNPQKAEGEMALEVLARDPRIEVLGVVAVASKTYEARGMEVDASISANGEILDHQAVNKDGDPDVSGVLLGDTVDVLNDLEIPVIIGMGDPGKQRARDLAMDGAPLTLKAIMEVLRRSETDA